MKEASFALISKDGGVYQSVGYRKVRGTGKYDRQDLQIQKAPDLRPSEKLLFYREQEAPKKTMRILVPLNLSKGILNFSENLLLSKLFLVPATAISVITVLYFTLSYLQVV